MAKNKIAPHAVVNGSIMPNESIQKAHRQEKRVSFRPSTNSSSESQNDIPNLMPSTKSALEAASSVTVTAHGNTLAQTLKKPPTTLDNTHVDRPRMRARVPSCPSNKSEYCENENNRRQELVSTRRRAQSMPAGSLASHDFFGTAATGVRKPIDADGLGRPTMEKVCEHHVLGEENNAVAKKQINKHPTQTQNAITKPTAKKEQEIVLKQDPPRKKEEESAKICQCITL